MTSFYIFSKRFFPKRKILFDARVGSLKSIPEKEYGFEVHIL